MTEKFHQVLALAIAVLILAIVLLAIGLFFAPRVHAASLDLLNPVEDATGDSVYVIQQRRCDTGTHIGLPCTVDADCPGAGTCVDTDTEGAQAAVIQRPPTATNSPSHRAITTGPAALRCFNDTPTAVGPCKLCRVVNHLKKNDATDQADPVWVGYSGVTDTAGGFPLYPGQSDDIDPGSDEDCNDVFVYGPDESKFSCWCLP